VAREVDAAHNHAAIFDVSCFGKIDVTGAGTEQFLQYTCAGNMAKAPGSAIYSAVLNSRGTFESDITALRFRAGAAKPQHARGEQCTFRRNRSLVRKCIATVQIM